MSILNIPIAKPWSVKLPALFRYTEQKWIDEFFDKGNLRLSSFRKFAKHKDEERHDAAEGMAGIDIHYGNEQHFTGIGFFGSEAYVLSTSTIESTDLIKQFEGGDGYFKINDSVAFAAAISAHIPGFMFGYEGLCIYKDARLVKGKYAKPLMPMPPPGAESEAEKYFAAVEQKIHEDTKLAPYFMKPLRYAHQSEYRFVWCASPPTKETINIACPEARRFCEKIT